MAKLIIFGAGDIARLAHYYFTRDSEHEVVAFTVDDQYKQGDSFLDLPLIAFENIAQHYPPAECKMFVALSYAKMNKIREEKTLPSGAFYFDYEVDYGTEGKPMMLRHIEVMLPKAAGGYVSCTLQLQPDQDAEPIKKACSSMAPL